MTTPQNNFFGITHIGLVRKKNEDRYLIKELEDKSVLLAVADGLGGEVAGDYAAEIIMEKLAGLYSSSGKDIQLELDQLTRAMDKTIYKKGQEK